MLDPIEVLVREAVEGDRKSFEKLVGMYAGLVTGIAYSRCGDFGISEDIAQEVFIEAWLNMKTIDDFKKFPSWISTVARRRSID